MEIAAPLPKIKGGPKALRLTRRNPETLDPEIMLIATSPFGIYPQLSQKGGGGGVGVGVGWVSQY